MIARWTILMIVAGAGAEVVLVAVEWVHAATSFAIFAWTK